MDSPFFVLSDRGTALSDQLTPAQPASRTPARNSAAAAVASPIEFRHLPALDGVRGIAVLTVMACHVECLVPALHNYLKGGFLGVDIFFVLSGFLITSILLTEQSREDNIDLVNFYLRRTLRLVPALWLFLIVLYSGAGTILPPEKAAEVYDQNGFLYAFTYLMNWFRAFGGEAGNLNHTWSLAIEEQFYVLWSLVLWTCFAESRSRRHIVTVTVMMIVFIWLERAVRATTGSELNLLLYSLDTRLDSLLIGCLASMIYCWRLVPARILQGSSMAVFTTAAFTGFLVVLVIAGPNDRAFFMGMGSLFNLCTGVLILWLAVNERGWPHRILEFRPLRWIGAISYGLYLWHYLSFEFAKKTVDGEGSQLVFGIVLAVSVSSASYYGFEKPLQRLRHLFQQRFAASAATSRA